ncbi:MAG: tryptophan 2,3-dioxygenase [Bdellovibrionales bacterium]|nr:tryptophan 2,3-dioxygenase [Bdellovibrionales bacterium]
MRYPPTHYHDYLQLDQVLNAQKLKSQEFQASAHDEMLFIITHQTYELWFKQLLHELTSVLEIFNKQSVSEKQMGLVVHRLKRFTTIQKLLIQQIDILETMTPLDFLDFRDFLFPASGFQSFQFRQLESLMGLPASQRLSLNSCPYHRVLKPDQSQKMQKLDNEINLFKCVEQWLSRTPFLKITGFDFWKVYIQSVEQMFASDRQTIIETFQNPEDQKKNLDTILQAEKSFSSLILEEEYKKSKVQGMWRMSFSALQAALFIQLYRDQPILQLPFKLLTSLIDMDELTTQWRYRHALMAKRMLGTKIGTGGSSGYDYLRQTTDQHRIFQDFNQLTTFLIPRSLLPELSEEVERKLGFYYGNNL